MNSRVIRRPERTLKDDTALLSPPVVSAPLYQCGTSLTVFSFAAHATIELDVAGSMISAPGGFPYPNGVTIPLPTPLVAGQGVRARQKSGSATSAWSNIVTVRDHTKDYPGGPPRPEINPAPVYQCGIRTGVGNLLQGGNVWITADATEVGRVNGCAQQQGVNVNPAYVLNQKVRAWFELCSDPSPPSVELTAGAPPHPMPALTIDPIYASSESVTVRSVVNGAKVTVYRGGVPQGTWPCWGGSLTINGLNPVSTGEVFSATQQMCSNDPPSPPTDGTVQPCSSLPAPQIGPVQGGDDQVLVTQFVPNAVIRVYINGVLAGQSGGPVVVLNKKVAKGDTLIIIQDLGGCKSQYALEVKVLCVDPPFASNPSSLDLFPVGWLEYKQGGVKGSVYYPADDDGESQPFNQRLTDLGRVPIVLMAHGNHSPSDPSYLGYDYFQKDLAKMGMIAVSVDCNALNGAGGGVANIEDRADLIIDSISHFQTLDTDPSSVFFQRIDFNRLGLMGHSRGGDAVVTVPTVISLAGVTIKSVLALAPTNFRYWSGMSTIRPKNHAFMTILPAGDGDVTDNNGAQFYDQAIPGPFKSQLYVHYTCHNLFNRQWLYNDGMGPPTIARFDHEQILTAYGCALFRATLLGQSTDGYLSGTKLPSGVMAQHVFRSFERTKVLTVDNHEDGNTINKNSLGRPTSQLFGMVGDEYAFSQGAGAFNSSFYGESTGMVVHPEKTGAIFRSSLVKVIDLTKREIWIRCAEVTDGSIVAGSPTGFELGLEDKNGVRVWVDCDDVGGLFRPYPRNPGMIKTMLSTLRFRGACFTGTRFNLKLVVAILIRCNRKPVTPIAFDDLQIY